MKPTHNYGAHPGALGALALAAVALLLAGCGGSSSSPGVAHLANTSRSPAASTGTTTSEGATSPGSPEAAALANAACMRSHGVPNFPDPTASGVVHLRGVDLSSPAFQAAQRACNKLFPNDSGKGAPPTPAEQTKMQEEALKFSQCMRAHGVPNFPDPPAGGGPKIEKGSGTDPNSPQFRTAQKTCAKGGFRSAARGNAVRGIP